MRKKQPRTRRNTISRRLSTLGARVMKESALKQRLEMVEKKVSGLMACLATGDLQESVVNKTLINGQRANANEIDGIKVMLEGVGRDQNSILERMDGLNDTFDRVLESLLPLTYAATRKTRKGKSKK